MCILAVQLHVIPRDLLPGLDISVFEMYVWLNRFLPLWLIDKCLLFLSWMTLGNTEKYGMRRPRHGGPLELQLKYGKSIVLDSGTVTKVKSGHIKVLLLHPASKTTWACIHDQLLHIADSPTIVSPAQTQFFNCWMSSPLAAVYAAGCSWDWGIHSNWSSVHQRDTRGLRCCHNGHRIQKHYSLTHQGHTKILPICNAALLHTVGHSCDT